MGDLLFIVERMSYIFITLFVMMTVISYLQADKCAEEKNVAGVLWYGFWFVLFAFNIALRIHSL